MAKDMEVIKRVCEVSPEEERLLLSPKRPIVLLRKIQNSGSGVESSKGKDISEKVAPGNRYLGFMLPYTPIHYLLFHAQSNLSGLSTLSDSCPPAGETGRGWAKQGDRSEGILGESLSVLVMTSGNFSDEPIIQRNDDAFVRLKDIADFILVHNRDIFVQCDDSVARIFRVTGDEIIVRRARGYVPEPIKVRLHHANIGSRIADSDVNNSMKVQGLAETSILATGTHLKNTFCLAKGNRFIISQHIGDLENFETFEAFGTTLEHFKKLFRIAPSVIACDLHPEYLAAKYAVEHTSLNPDIRLVKVQHHHAHIASCMADNDMENHEVIGVAFDGTGFGSDGRLWGGEFLAVDYTKFERIAHLKYFRLPGGEKAIKEPWRIAVGLLYERFGENFLELGLDFTKRLDKEKGFFLREMLDKGINCPYTSSIGRLFDAVSSLVGLREKVTYEGEAAIELEMAIRDEGAEGYYKYEVRKENNTFTIDYSPIIEGVVVDLKNGESVSVISQKFHNTVAELILKVCSIIRSDFRLSEVVLSGGVFQNMFLLRKAYRRLTESGFKVYVNRRVPANDGGISLGQAVIASYGR
jgi:hydrogenase maturation protein HypF